MDAKRPFYRLKSDWAAAEAKAVWESLRKEEATHYDNYARKRETLANLRRLASTWEGRAAQYRREEAQRAA